MPVMFPEITQQPQPIDWTEGGVWDNKRWNEEQIWGRASGRPTALVWLKYIELSAERGEVLLDSEFDPDLHELFVKWGQYGIDIASETMARLNTMTKPEEDLLIWLHEDEKQTVIELAARAAGVMKWGTIMVSEGHNIEARQKAQKAEAERWKTVDFWLEKADQFLRNAGEEALNAAEKIGKSGGKVIKDVVGGVTGGLGTAGMGILALVLVLAVGGVGAVRGRRKKR